MKKQGSALIFVMVILAGIVTVAVGAQRLSLVQFNQATREEDNLFAYYAAKAGLEDGLLRFRFQRNVETPVNTVHRFDITAGKSAGEITAGDIAANNPSGFEYDPSHQYYDLSVDFRTNQIGDFNFLNNANNTSPTLQRDSSVQLTGFPNASTYPDQYYLRYAYKFIGSDCLAKGAFVQMERIQFAGGTETVFDQRKVTLTNPNGIIDSTSANALNNWEISNAGNLVNFIRIRPFHCDIQYAFTTATAPRAAGGGPTFDSLETKVTATGYFGKTKRTLQAVVDRESGTLITIYDFNLYSGDGTIRSRS